MPNSEFAIIVILVISISTFDLYIVSCVSYRVLYYVTRILSIEY